jgi:hypothetical protein
MKFLKAISINFVVIFMVYSDGWKSMPLVLFPPDSNTLPVLCRITLRNIDIAIDIHNYHLVMNFKIGCTGAPRESGKLTGFPL